MFDAVGVAVDRDHDAIRSENADLMEIDRPAGVGKIADLSLTLAEAKQLLSSAGGGCVPDRGAWSASAGLPGLSRWVPGEGLAIAPCRDAVW
jgi:hypothetical protein